MLSDGSTRIIQEILKAADAQSAELIADAQAQAQKLLKEAEEKAEYERQHIIASVAQEAQLEAQRILAEARVREKRAKLLLQEELIQAAFTRGFLMLESFAKRGSDHGIVYRDMLVGLAKEAMLSVGQQTMELLCNERDRHIFDRQTVEDISREISAAVGKQVSLRLAAETISCCGGVIVRDSANRLCVDNTFEARLERSRQSLRTEIMRILFTPGTP